MLVTEILERIFLSINQCSVQAACPVRRDDSQTENKHSRKMQMDNYKLVGAAVEIVKTCVVRVNAARDYCQWDKFVASCPSRDQLVVMKSAVYGRMASGHCIERDYGYVGCQSDVLLQADARCSGRRECRLDIPYQPFDVGHPCPRDLTRFLRASFVCVKGEICSFC